MAYFLIIGDQKFVATTLLRTTKKQGITNRNDNIDAHWNQSGSDG
jgi:hypothetical protein